jgi:hypothetical protein
MRLKVTSTKPCRSTRIKACKGSFCRATTFHIDTAICFLEPSIVKNSIRGSREVRFVLVEVHSSVLLMFLGVEPAPVG